MSNGDYEIEYYRRIAATKKMLWFTKYTKLDYQVNWHHNVVCHKLDEWIAGKIKRLMLFMPPRHGKSELASRRLPAFILGKNPNAKIITTSYSDDLASQMNRDVQRIIDSRRYKNVFPETMLSGKNIKTIAYGSYLRNSSIFEIVGHGGSYRSSGVGGGITGMGFDYGIIDDPIKNRQDAESKAISDGIYNWYMSTFYSRRDHGDNACIMLIMTRWHENDLAGKLLGLQAMGGEYTDKWEVVNFPAIAEKDKSPGDIREEGDALWPDKFSVKSLKTTRANITGYEWDSLYQQRPNPPGGGKIKRDWFKIIDKPPDGLSWQRFWDLAVSAKKSADFTASPSAARDEDGNIYLRNMIRGQWEWPETKRIIIPTARNEKIPVGIEEAGQQKGFIDELIADKELAGISIKGYRPDKDKLTRALPWISRAEAGKVYLVNGSWVNEFLNECQVFTGLNDKRDDQIDGVSGVYQMIADTNEQQMIFLD